MHIFLSFLKQFVVWGNKRRSARDQSMMRIGGAGPNEGGVCDSVSMDEFFIVDNDTNHMSVELDFLRHLNPANIAADPRLMPGAESKLTVKISRLGALHTDAFSVVADFIRERILDRMQQAPLEPRGLMLLSALDNTSPEYGYTFILTQPDMALVATFHHEPAKEQGWLLQWVSVDTNEKRMAICNTGFFQYVQDWAIYTGEHVYRMDGESCRAWFSTSNFEPQGVSCACKSWLEELVEAFVMGTHRRLGENCAAQGIDEFVAWMIGQYVLQGTCMQVRTAARQQQQAV